MSEGDAIARLEDVGLDLICDQIRECRSMSQIAKSVGLSKGSLTKWINADPKRSARVREVRAEVAILWDEKASQTLKSAKDPFELQKARELAHHYRWRAKMINPKDYGDKRDDPPSEDDKRIVITGGF